MSKSSTAVGKRCEPNQTSETWQYSKLIRRTCQSARFRLEPTREAPCAIRRSATSLCQLIRMAIVRAWQLLWLEVYADLDAVYRPLLQRRLYRLQLHVDSQCSPASDRTSYSRSGHATPGLTHSPPRATSDFSARQKHRLLVPSPKLGTVCLGIPLPRSLCGLFSNAVLSPDTLRRRHDSAPPTGNAECDQGTVPQPRAWNPHTFCTIHLPHVCAWYVHEMACAWHVNSASMQARRLQPRVSRPPSSAAAI